jgi:hypothetical protein
VYRVALGGSATGVHGGVFWAVLVGLFGGVVWMFGGVGGVGFLAP